MIGKRTVTDWIKVNPGDILVAKDNKGLLTNQYPKMPLKDNVYLFLSIDKTKALKRLDFISLIPNVKLSVTPFALPHVVFWINATGLFVAKDVYEVWQAGNYTP